MFLHYFAAGLTLPLMSLYFSQELNFGGTGAGIILAVSAISAVLSPVLGAFVTDRLLSAERLFALCELLAALFIFLLWASSSFWAVLIFYLCYMGMFIPAMALSNTIVFHHSPDGGRSFGGVRLWGTVGWVCAGWIFSFFWLRVHGGDVSDALVCTAIAEALLALYALRLPGQKGASPRRKSFFPASALRVFMRPETALLAIAAFSMQLSHRIYYFGAAPYLRHLGLGDEYILPLMSIGQAMEVVSLLLFPLILRYLSYRRILLLGTVMELCRFSFLCFGTSSLSALAGIAFHGPAFAFFFTIAFMYVNTFADQESRAGVQQLIFLIIEGAGTLGGNILAGALYDLASDGGAVVYSRFWGPALGIAGLSFFLMTVLNHFHSQGDSAS